MSKSSKDFLEMRESEQLEPVKSKMDKPNLNAQIQNIVGSVERGDVNPLEAFIFLNFMQKIADAAKKRLLEQAMGEAEKYPEREATVYDATVTIKNGAGRYDYSGIKEIEEKEKELMELKEKAKFAYAAKLVGNIITDKETGEIINPAKYKPNSKTLAITFK